MLKAIIFDLDGTLTDSDKVHFQVFQEIFSQRGIALDKALYREKISGHQNAEIVAEFFPELPAAAGEAFSAEKEATFRAIAQDKLTPLPGLLDLLSQIERRGLAKALVTNAPRENAAFMLAALNLRETFHPVVIGDDLPRAKPDPLPYQTALNKLAIAPAEAIVFEDSPTGIRAATGAGILTVGVTTTHPAEKLMAAGASEAIADFADPYVRAVLAEGDGEGMGG